MKYQNEQNEDHIEKENGIMEKGESLPANSQSNSGKTKSQKETMDKWKLLGANKLEK